MRDQKLLYREWAEGQTQLPLFHQPWWLDAVAGESWDVALVKDGGGDVIGAMPYYRFRKYGMFEVVSNPMLTPYLGPYLIFPEGQKRESRYSFAKRVLEELIGQLPRVPLVFVKANPDLDYALPFHWAGFREFTRYTYRFEASSHVDEVFDGLKGSVRTALRKAGDEIELRSGGTTDDFYPLNKEVFRRQNKSIPYDKAFLSKVFEAAFSRDQADILLATDASGTAVAGVMIVRDSRYAYLLATGRSSKDKEGFLTALVWQAITESLDRGLGFDFEGSMLPGVEHFFRGFGGELTPYAQFYRGGSKLWEVLGVLR